jgi:hypothetical protein
VPDPADADPDADPDTDPGADADPDTGDTDDGVRAAVAGERALHDPAVRRDPERAGALLDPEFVEFGASGRRWDRASLLAAMAEEPADSPMITVSDLAWTELGDDLVQLTYTSEAAGRRARRSSLWRRTDGRWLLLFHQGTPLPADRRQGSRQGSRRTSGGRSRDSGSR